MAYAETGDCDKAVDWQSQAWEAALDADDQTLAESLKLAADHYQTERPCRYPAAGFTPPLDGPPDD